MSTGLLEPTEEADRRSLVVDGLPGHFTLHYQPEFDLYTDLVTGCEALLRWTHPDYGTLRPGVALHRTRWTSLLRRAETWAVGVAIEQSARWNDEGRDLQVAINLSRQQLNDPGIVDQIEACIERSGADHRDLRVDIPMGAFTLQSSAAHDVARELASSGLTIVADGVSGEPRRALADAPVSVCKITLHVTPRRLTGLHPSVVASLGLARDLDAIAVAKAVRRTTDLSTLRRAGFHRAFGDVLSPAVRAEELTALLSN